MPDDFRLLVIVPDEILHLPPGGGPATTWTAEAKNGTAEWVRTIHAPTVRQLRASKL